MKLRLASDEMSQEPLKVTMFNVTKKVASPRTALEQENVVLAKENAGLQHRLSLAQENAALALENARLAEQNAILTMSQGGRARDVWCGPQGGYCYGMPPGYAPWANGNPWAMDPLGYGIGPPPPHFYHSSGGFFPGAVAANIPPDGDSTNAAFDAGYPNSLMFQKMCASGKAGGSETSMPRLSTPSVASTRSSGSRVSGLTQGSEATSTFSTRSVSEDHGKTSLEGPPTTVMMRNIPNDYTRELLLTLIEENGFAGQYDLVYLPVDFKTEVGLGYSFINFIEPRDAERFHMAFHGFQDWSVLSEKICEVSWSDALQGLDGHVERFRNSPVMHETVPDEFKPALFKDGVRMDFPPPTKKIRAPRPWSRRQGCT